MRNETYERHWREQAAQIIAAALHAVDPSQAVRRYMQRQEQWLQVAGRRYDLDQYERVFVVGGGKASPPMAAATLDVLGERLTSGIITVKRGHSLASWRVSFGDRLSAKPIVPVRLPGSLEVIEAQHPVPDEAGLEGTQRIHDLLSHVTERDLVVCLLSGGASALLPLPAPGISLEELQELTLALLRSGATINEFNSVRKHCSQLKGGQLARRASPATLICLILSDVVGSPLDTIGSGPTVPDPTTFNDAYAVLQRYGLLQSVPQSVLAHLQRGMAGEVTETPKEGDPCFRGVHNVIIGDNRLAARAAQERAQELGLASQILTTYAEGEAREVAKLCAALAKEMADSGLPLAPPACLIVGGETTVTVRGSGQGGRNQELALAAAVALEGWERTMVVTLATDGGDGPTDAAGAVVTGQTACKARKMGLDPEAFLAENDSYSFFANLGGLLFTGPTNTNVNDLTFIFAF